MNRPKLTVACLVAGVLSLLAPSAWAQGPTNQLTFFTFSAPFELPGGKVMPAGKYAFRVVDSPSNRHVVQVLDESQRTMHATLLAVSAQRSEPAREPEVRFMESAANLPPAVRTWWYPGRSTGHEFIYPRDHAKRLAARQREGVLTTATDASTTEQIQSASLSRITASGEEAADTTAAPARAEARTTTTAAPRAAAPATANDRADAPAAPPARARRTMLPKTASALPLLGLAGLGLLLGAGLLRLRRR